MSTWWRNIKRKFINDDAAREEHAPTGTASRAISFGASPETQKLLKSSAEKALVVNNKSGENCHPNTHKQSKRRKTSHHSGVFVAPPNDETSGHELVASATAEAEDRTTTAASDVVLDVFKEEAVLASSTTNLGNPQFGNDNLITPSDLNEGDTPTEGADNSLTSLPSWKWKEMKEMVEFNDLSPLLCASKIEVFRTGEDRELKEWKALTWHIHPVFPLSGEEVSADDHRDALGEEGVLRSSDQGDSSPPRPLESPVIQAGMVASLLADPISDSPRQLLRQEELFTDSPQKYHYLHHWRCDCTSVEFYFNEDNILRWRCPKDCLPAGSQLSNEESNTAEVSSDAVPRSIFHFGFRVEDIVAKKVKEA